MSQPPHDWPGHVERGRWRPSRKLIASAVLVVLALVFVFQNTKRGRVNVFFWHVTLPAWIWLLVIFLVGVVVGSVFPWFRRQRKSPPSP